MDTPETLEKVPSLYEHCVAVYDAMYERADLERLESGNNAESTTEVLVYEGFLTKLITKDLHLSVPYYTSTTRRLKAMDCIRQLRRGGSSSPSRWAVLQPPTLEAFNRTIEKGTTQRRPIDQQISDLNKRLLAVEDVLIPEGVDSGDN